MDIRIKKTNVTYCEICDDVKELKNSWEEDQTSLIENGEQEEIKPFPGVPGYLIKDADDYRYSHNEICERCIQTLMKGVNIINNEDLTGISLDTNK